MIIYISFILTTAECGRLLDGLLSGTPTPQAVHPRGHNMVQAVVAGGYFVEIVGHRLLLENKSVNKSKQESGDNKNRQCRVKFSAVLLPHKHKVQHQACNGKDV